MILAARRPSFDLHESCIGGCPGRDRANRTGFELRSLSITVCSTVARASSFKRQVVIVFPKLLFSPPWRSSVGNAPCDHSFGTLPQLRHVPAPNSALALHIPQSCLWAIDRRHNKKKERRGTVRVTSRWRSGLLSSGRASHYCQIQQACGARCGFSLES